ncbi:transposase [Planobispora longispora]|uniref:transposase n=1 Tax=Planobispora longispora TaxID=28887 RepID=UPI0035A24F45
MTRRFDLTDAQWAVLQPLLPAPTRSGRPPLFSERQLIGGIRWRARVGAPWRDVPDCYAPWGARAAGGPPRCIWPASRGTSHWRSC